MEFLIAWFTFSILAGWIASQKGRSGFGFFLLSLFLSPLIGIIAAAAARSRDAIDSSHAQQAGTAGGWRKCPFCAEAIRIEAIKCKHCGSDVKQPAASPLDGSKPTGKWVNNDL